MKMFRAVMFGFGLGLCGCATTPGMAKMQGQALTEAEEAECSQRAMGSVEAAAATGRSPTSLGEYEGWDEQRRDWVTRNNPCLDTASAQARATKGEEEQRAFARTRARMLLDNGEPAQAREALIPAFYSPPGVDAQIYELAREASEGLREQDAAQGDEVCRLIAPASGEPVVVWSGQGAAQLRCKLPETTREHEGVVRLVVRQRLGVGRRQVVWTWSPEVANIKEAPLELSAPLELPAMLEGRSPGARAYYTFAAEVVREGHPVRTVAQGELFWFAQE